MRNIYGIIVFLLLASATGGALAQLQPSDQMVTITADSLVNTKINGELVQKLIGNVRFRQGDLSGSANEAWQYQSRNVIELRGNVNVIQDYMTLQAPLVTYDGTTKIARAENGVFLSDRDASVNSSRATYDLNSQRAEFIGNVKARDSQKDLTSARLVYYRGSQTMVATKDVVVKSTSGTLYADEVTNDRIIGETSAKGKVHFENDSIILNADKMYQSDPLGLMTASGNVGVLDKSNSTVIVGDTLARLSKLNYVVAPKSPLLMVIDSSLKEDSLGVVAMAYDTLFMIADTMQAYSGDSAKFIGLGHVRLIRSDFSGIGEELVYNRQTEFMRLVGNRPRMWQDETEIAADSIHLFSRDRKVEYVWGLGGAFATSPFEDSLVSGRINQLTAQRMVLNVDDDTVRYLLGIDNALSIYFVSNDGKASGVNRSSGDSIRLDFHDNNPTRVAILGGTEGEYIPERFVGSRGGAFRLGAFDRKPELRPTLDEFYRRRKPIDFTRRNTTP